ncbi:MAG: GNAT family N-acetyltransferase [Deltaproteobacteria bacterium]|nr:MAG: GNAT family N-acetyltransferase [Deltaproteobacteria bacterium]
MSLYNLDKIFKAQSVVLVGASEKPGTIGNQLVRNLLNPAFKGDAFFVNPRYHSICGHKCYTSIKQIAKPPDLAVIAVPIASVPAIIRECVETGVGGAVIISAGGKETGQEGQKIELMIKEEAEKGGLRIIGPNCMGIICAEVGLNATFAVQYPPPGKLAFISQSGAICSSVLDLSLEEKIGFRYFVSIGSMLDVDFGDLINYVGNDPHVSSIIMYMECISNARKFMSATRAVSRIKPIIVLKAGKSPAGAIAASSHTGALAGEDSIYEVAFERAGAVRVDTIEELFDCAELMAKTTVPSGKRLLIVTNGGGPGVMATDAIASYGMELATLDSSTVCKLDQFLPPVWSRANPIDIIGDATAERWRRAIEVCLDTRDVEGLILIYVPQALSRAEGVAKSIADLVKDKRRFPVFAVWMGGKEAAIGRKIFNQAGIPTYDTPERAVSAFRYMYCYVRNQQMSQEIPTRLKNDLIFERDEALQIITSSLNKGSSLLSEIESKALLGCYGIPVVSTHAAETVGEAVQIAKRVGYPVVLKVLSSDITHKSDVGGVRLNLQSDKEVEEAFEAIVTNARRYNPRAKIRGVTVQPMLTDVSYELIIGSKQDPLFGPVILFGMGGVMAEIWKDYALGLPPLNRLLARRLMEKTRVYQALSAYRNMLPADLEPLEEILIRVSQLVTDFAEITELDINPLIVTRHQCMAADARVIVKATTVSGHQHLVISPYPEQYEMETTSARGVRIFIRPIKPEDATALIELFNNLSPRSIYYRFFSPLRSLPPKLVARFTQIDYDRDMALVALAVQDGKVVGKMLGVSRLLGDPDGEKAEFAIVVADPWQGKGIGSALMEKLINIAKERGMKYLWGLALPENTQMLALGRKLGFKITRNMAEGLIKLEIELTRI